MAKIAFVTDSTTGFPRDLQERFDVEVAPLQVIFNGTENFRDGIDLTQDQFFERLKTSKNLPTTSQPSVGDFTDAFKNQAADPGVESIIAVVLSSGLSGTYNAATQAAEAVANESGKRIDVIDSRSLWWVAGFMLLNAGRAVEAGKSHDEVLALVNGMVGKAKLLVLVDTLEYLAKGGRIGGAQAFLGGLLNVKPLLHVEGGRVEPLERVRTRRKAMERLVELGVEATHGKPSQIAIGHAHAPEDALQLAEMVRARLNVKEMFTGELGPVISTHTGPGVLGFVYYTPD